MMMSPKCQTPGDGDATEECFTKHRGFSMKTTADYRKAALEAEQNCNWREAARLWLSAIEHYPHDSGELALRDIKHLQERARHAATLKDDRR
jgi:hypothetical protein